MNMKPLSDDLGYVYISELTSPDASKVENFDVVEKPNVFYVKFRTCLHSFDVMNRNNRMYDASNIQENLNTERIQHYLSHGGWFGEQNHPTAEYSKMELSPQRIQDIDMTNTSHKMLNPKIVGNLLISDVESDAGTAAGMNLARKMVQGFIPGFSCRAIARMELKNGKPYVNVRKIITYDWVLYQSHREAEQDTSVKNSFITKTANAIHAVAEKASDICVPLKEILTYAGYHDVNAQVVMESFDLSVDNICGFDKENKHMIIKDDNNFIYCNLTPDTRNKVNDFLRSF